jgi:DNA-binding MarR family transcriptional regulator
VKSNDSKKTADYLSLVTGYLYRRQRYEARGLGIRWTALMVLKDLAELGPTSQRRLADIEQTTEPTMTVLIQQLLDKGWVSRKIHQHDSRVKHVAITKLGRQELLKAGSFLRQKMLKELKHLSTQELTALESALIPLVNSIRLEMGKTPSDK